jgi:hypothetical protein
VEMKDCGGCITGGTFVRSDPKKFIANSRL